MSVNYLTTEEECAIADILFMDGWSTISSDGPWCYVRVDEGIAK